MTLQEENEYLRERVRDLEAVLGQRSETIANTFKLSPAMTNLLGLLLALPVVKAEAIHHRLGIASDAKVAMHRLREELQTWGIEVKSKRLFGYWLDDATKDKIRDMMDAPPRSERKPPEPLAA